MGISPLSTATSFSATTGVIAGQQYRFRVRAKNKYGWGPWGPEALIYAAAAPEAPPAPATARAGTAIRISWDAPDHNGLAVTQYEILILAVDGSSWAATASCDGASGPVVQDRQCEVLMTTLRSAPYALVLNSAVTAKVRAYNPLGWGPYSQPTAAGATIQTEPAAPPQAITEGAATDDTQVQIVWYALTGDAAGQDTVTLYEVYWDSGTADAGTGVAWALLIAESAGSFTFTRTITSGITAGRTYQFYYRASNQHGTGANSAISTITASAVPAQLGAPTTAHSGTDIVTTWPATTSDRGAAVTGYRVKFKRNDGAFAELASCDGSTEPAVGGRTCTVPMGSFTAPPFSLPVGASIVATVEARNDQGYSPVSPEGSGALA